jgi:L-malate glycosyltransferase
LGKAILTAIGKPQLAATTLGASARPRLRTVCQLLHSLCVGGAETLAARLARSLGADYRFVFVCLDELGPLGRELRDEGLPVHVLARRSGLDWHFPRRLGALWRRERVDLVHAHQYTPFFYAMAARLLYRRPAVLFTEHGRHFPDFPRRKRIMVNRMLLERRDRIVGVGQSVRYALIENEGLPAERVQVIYNGVSLPAIAARAGARAEVREELGIGEGDPLILQVARLDYLKDHGTALRTLKHLLRWRPDAKLVLVGDGPERSGIERLARELNLESNIRMLGLRKDVARLLAAADVFLLTSISEGIPLTIIEAMAAGVPVVATRVGGITEMIIHEKTGCLAGAGDAETLADQILRLISDNSLHALIAHTGRETAHRMFSEQQMQHRYAALYEDMLHA